jgi:hypothetical protein
MPSTKRTAKATPNAASSKQTPSASTTGYVPTWEVPVLLKGAEWGAKATEKLADWLKNEGALAIQILDSRQDGKEYVVRFRATNMSIHAVYVCSAELTWPYAERLHVKALRHAISFGVDAASEDRSSLKSHLIGSGKAMEFSISFRTPSAAELNAGLFKQGLGTAQLEYWPLDEAKSKHRPLSFAVRLEHADSET